MKRWLRTLHKWTGLILALQFVLWMVSGMAMSLLDSDAVAGVAHRTKSIPTPKPWPSGLLPPAAVLAAAQRPIDGLETAWLLERPMYRLNDGAAVWLVDAQEGHPVGVNARDAATVATADYIGAGARGVPEWQPHASSEARGHAGPVWRIAFADTQDTALYVSAADGRILERRNRSWRWFDRFWMLHIMDYGGRKNFNNPLVIGAALGGLWLAFSGLWLLLRSFRVTSGGRPNRRETA